MNKEQREQMIDKLLVHLNDQVEEMGGPIGCVRFDFQSAEDQWDKESLALLNTDVEGLQRTLNACLSRGYLKHSYMTQLCVGIVLTEEGQGRAISVDAAKRNPQPALVASSPIHIGTVNSNGATQIGHGNVQNAENVIQAWLKQIDAVEAPQEQKDEAKGLLRKFIEHPLVNTCLGIAGGFAAQAMGAK